MGTRGAGDARISISRATLDSEILRCAQDDMPGSFVDVVDQLMSVHRLAEEALEFLQLLVALRDGLRFKV